MTYPNGAIPGLCSSATTCLAVCLAFLGVWGFQGSGRWHAVHLVVVVPLLLAAVSFGFTPLAATRPTASPETLARKLYATGLVLLMLAVAGALSIAYAA